MGLQTLDVANSIFEAWMATFYDLQCIAGHLYEPFRAWKALSLKAELAVGDGSIVKTLQL